MGTESRPFSSSGMGVADDENGRGWVGVEGNSPKLKYGDVPKLRVYFYKLTTDLVNDTELWVPFFSHTEFWVLNCDWN